MGVRRQADAFSRTSKVRTVRSSMSSPVASLNSAKCGIHEALRITPAMTLGVTDHIWTIGELVEVRLAGEAPKPTGRRFGSFWVIDGGLT
jgi:hypothetical protein